MGALLIVLGVALGALACWQYLKGLCATILDLIAAPVFSAVLSPFQVHEVPVESRPLCLPVFLPSANATFNTQFNSTPPWQPNATKTVAWRLALAALTATVFEAATVKVVTLARPHPRSGVLTVVPSSSSARGYLGLLPPLVCPWPPHPLLHQTAVPDPSVTVSKNTILTVASRRVYKPVMWFREVAESFGEVKVYVARQLTNMAIAIVGLAVAQLSKCATAGGFAVHMITPGGWLKPRPV